MNTVLILASRYTRTDSILRDIGAALSHHGFSVSCEDRHLKKDDCADDTEWLNHLAERIYEASPDFIIMNGIEGIISSESLKKRNHLLDMLQIPFISVNFDSPIKSLYSRIDMGRSRIAAFAINERRYIDHLKSFGFRNVIYFPGAADSALSENDSTEMPPEFYDEADCLFVGDLLNQSRLTWSRFELAVHIMPRVLREMRASHLPLNKIILNHIESLVDQGELTRADFSAKVHAELYGYAVDEYNFIHRRQILSYCTDYRVRAVGSGWESINWPNITGIESADYKRELPSVYRNTPVTVGISSCESLTAAPLDVFSCFASGGFMVSDFREDLANFFEEGEEIDFFRSGRDLKEKLKTYLSNPGLREDISGRARDKIFREHTWERRVIKLIEEMERVTGETSRAPRYTVPAVSSKGPSVTAALIVRNEEPLLEYSLKSLSGHVDEIVTVDTGSVDMTPEVARSAGARVFFAEWKHDFSSARNRCLEKAETEWILIINADEVLSESDIPLKEQLMLLPSHADAASVTVVPDTLSPHTEVRILRNRKKIRFRGRVREYACVRNGTTVEDLPVVLSQQRVAGTLKGNAMIRISIAQGPVTLHMLYSLVINLDREKETEDIIKFGEQFLRSVSNVRDIPRDYIEVFSVLCGVYVQKEDFSKALQAAYRVLNEVPDEPDMWWTCGTVYYRLKQYRTAFLAFRRYRLLLGSSTHEKVEEFDRIYCSIREEHPEFGSYKSALPDVSISVCLLFLDNFDGLDETLDSVRLYADEVIIGNATGIAGRNIPVVPDGTVRLINLDWKNSFAEAYTTLKRLARKQWILFLDPDDRIAPESQPLLRDIISFSAFQDNADAYNVICDAYTDGRVFKRSVQPRLIKASGSAVFKGNTVFAVEHSERLPCLEIVINDRGRDLNTERSIHYNAVKNSILDDIDEQDKGTADYYYELVAAQAEGGEWTGVVVNAPRALMRIAQQEKPPEPTVSRHLSSLMIQGLIELECYDEAEQYSRELSERSPDFLDGYYMLVISCVRQKKYTAGLAAAIRSYAAIRKKLLKGLYNAGPPLYGLFQNGGLEILKGGLACLKGRSGIRQIRQGLALTEGAVPGFVSAFFRDNSSVTTQYPGIEDEFEQYPDSKSCLLLLIEWDTIKGDMDRKIKHLNRLARVAPFYRGDTEYYKAEIFLKRGKREEAVRHFLEAVPQYQEVISSGVRIPADMLVRYAESLERTGRMTTAVGIYEFLLKVCSKSEEEAIRNKISQLKQFIGA